MLLNKEQVNHEIKAEIKSNVKANENEHMTIPMAYLTEPEQIFQKVTWSHKRPQIATVS